MPNWLFFGLGFVAGVCAGAFLVSLLVAIPDEPDDAEGLWP